MRWRRIIGCGGEPRRDIRDCFEWVSNHSPGDVESERTLRNAGVAQPDDVVFTMIELRTVMIMSVECVRLRVSVDE